MEVLNDVMAKNLSDKSLTPEKLSRMFKMNDHNFKKLVRKHTGMTVSGFIKHYKWKRAKDVLISKGGNVHEASDALGFINYNYFITKFRDMFDETPKQYFLRIMSLKNSLLSPNFFVRWVFLQIKMP
jgi:AraC-like DNA-binding protein